MQYTEWLHLHCIHTYLTPKIWTPCESDYHPMRSGRYDHITTHLHFASTCSLDTDLIVIAGVDVRVLHTKCLSDHLAASEPTHRLTLPITFQNRRSNTHLTQRLLILSTTTTTSFAFRVNSWAPWTSSSPSSFVYLSMTAGFSPRLPVWPFWNTHTNYQVQTISLLRPHNEKMLSMSIYAVITNITCQTGAAKPKYSTFACQLKVKLVSQRVERPYVCVSVLMQCKFHQITYEQVFPE